MITSPGRTYAMDAQNKVRPTRNDVYHHFWGRAYSHSMVAGGLEQMSQATRLMPCSGIRAAGRIHKAAPRTGWTSLPTRAGAPRVRTGTRSVRGHSMNSIVYLVGAVVIIVAILSFFGLR